MPRLSFALASAVALALLLPLGPPPAAQPVYTENVKFSVRMSETSYSAPVNEVYLLVDRFGGRNRLQNAKKMNNAGGDLWEVTVPLAEGDYIYVFVANPTQYVVLSDANLNPDDVPDSNFFNDPHPRTAGWGGQYSTDNLLFVRNPNRPVFKKEMSTPKAGTLLTSAATPFSIRIDKGQDQKPIDAASFKVRIERNEPYGLVAGPDSTPPIDLVDVPGAAFAPDGTGGVLRGTLNDLPEGLHVLHVDASAMGGLEADTYRLPLFINQHNERPIADAGPSRFTTVGRYVELEGGLSRDPDQIGFSSFTWRKISGPGNMELRTLSQEPRNGDTSQRWSDGSPVFDEHGNIVGDLRDSAGAVPQARFDQPGDYVIGLVVTDREGLASEEATTTIHVSSGFDASLRMRLHVGTRNGHAAVSAAASSIPDGAQVRFVADADTPVQLSASDAGPHEVTLQNAAPGTYFIHAQAKVGNDSYPAQAVVNVHADGTVDGRDIAVPPEDWKNEAVLYLLFIREFYDSDGDGEGDLKGATEKLEWIKRLGANAIWLMPVEPSSTTHGYSMDSFFAVHSD